MLIICWRLAEKLLLTSSRTSVLSTYWSLILCQLLKETAWTWITIQSIIWIYSCFHDVWVCRMLKYKHSVFPYPQGKLTSSVVQAGYASSPMNLGSVVVYGVRTQPAKVTVNKRPVPFQYDTANKVRRLWHRVKVNELWWFNFLTFLCV